MGKLSGGGKMSRRSEEFLNSEIADLAKRKPEIVFKTRTMIYFREIEDLIAHILRHKRKYKAFRLPAWRYYCREDGKTGTSTPQNRLYYLIEAETPVKKLAPGIGQTREIETEWMKLVTGDATDYSGHGSSDMELAEHFITKVLKLPLEERPLSCLVRVLCRLVWKLKGGGKT